MKPNLRNHMKPAKRILLTAVASITFTTVLAGCGSGNHTEQQSEAPAAQVSAEPEESKDVNVTPDNLHTLLLSGEYETIYANLSDEFKQQVSEAELTNLGKEALREVQSLEQVTSMNMNGNELVRWVSESSKLGLLAIFDGDGVITGLQLQDITPPAQVVNTPTTISYDIPLRGDWFVFWGGENVLVNYHYALEQQRYAYDLIQVKDGFSYAGDPLQNESYFAFGQEVLAPADGTVVSVVHEIADNAPVGVMNEKQPAGNVVVIDHGGEFSTLAHLKQGSTTVKVGDKVSSGDVVGLVGNSGNSSEAHLHYQVSDGADLFSSKSLNIQWKDGLRPIQGDTISGNNVDEQ